MKNCLSRYVRITNSVVAIMFIGIIFNALSMEKETLELDLIDSGDFSDINKDNESPRKHKRQRSSSFTYSSRPILFNEEEYALFFQAQRIAQFIIDYNKVRSLMPLPQGPIFEDTRLSMLSKKRTKTGLYLVFFDDVPVVLLTPWGQWKFCSKKNVSIDKNSIMHYLQMCLTVQEVKTSANKISGFGPLLKIISLQGINLPEATPKSHNKNNKKEIKNKGGSEDTIEVVELRKIWHAMLVRYKKECGIIDALVTMPEEKTEPVCTYRAEKPQKREVPQGANPAMVAELALKLAERRFKTDGPFQ